MEPIVVCIKAALFTLYFEAKNQTNVGAVGSTFYCLGSNALKIKTNVEMYCPRLRQHQASVDVDKWPLPFGTVIDNSFIEAR